MLDKPLPYYSSLQVSFTGAVSQLMFKKFQKRMQKSCLPPFVSVMHVLLLMLQFCRHLWTAYGTAPWEMMWHFSGLATQMIVTVWCQSTLD